MGQKIGEVNLRRAWRTNPLGQIRRMMGQRATRIREAMRRLPTPPKAAKTVAWLRKGNGASADSVPGNNKYYPPAVTTTYVQLTPNPRCPRSKLVLACPRTDTFYPRGPVAPPYISAPSAAAATLSPAFQATLDLSPGAPRSAASHPRQLKTSASQRLSVEKSPPHRPAL